jgi:hypothetical protein
MSPSKMRKTQWFRQGQTARMLGEPRASNPYDGDPAYYVRRRAWFAGWDEPPEEEVQPEPDKDFADLMAEVAENPTTDETPGVADDPLGDQIVALAREWVKLNA